ncbi:MAG: TIGR04282 family arsenosugar biosynthesis glycosyltransferase [Candidatus Thermoplasmatota archaeon]|nr:TIGR04282 family arsenosugar biosynthesis glycosyltransferase [Candidatus Thermoplasmatota archaeon]
MIKDQDCCILLFIKYPEKGKVKQRLLGNLNEEIVQGLYKCFVHDTLSTLQKMNGYLLICFLPADAQEKFQQWLGSTLRFLPQRGSNLGERMKNSFISAFSEGFQRVILMGSDSPDIPIGFLQKACSELQAHDMVLGPTYDGGYYLIGFQDTAFDQKVFENIQWGTPSVYTETLKKIKKKHRRLSVLPVWSDVDTITDLKNLLIRNQNTSFRSSMTITYLQQQRIFTEDDDDIRQKK